MQLHNTDILMFDNLGLKKNMFYLWYYQGKTVWLSFKALNNLFQIMFSSAFVVYYMFVYKYFDHRNFLVWNWVVLTCSVTYFLKCGKNANFNPHFLTKTFSACIFHEIRCTLIIFALKRDLLDVIMLNVKENPRKSLLRGNKVVSQSKSWSPFLLWIFERFYLVMFRLSFEAYANGYADKRWIQSNSTKKCFPFLCRIEYLNEKQNLCLMCT